MHCYLGLDAEETHTRGQTLQLNLAEYIKQNMESLELERVWQQGKHNWRHDGCSELGSESES